VAGVIGIDSNLEGLAMAKASGIDIPAQGIEGARELPHWADTKILVDATSAGAHAPHGSGR